jgi:hypothetical protein
VKDQEKGFSRLYCWLIFLCAAFIIVASANAASKWSREQNTSLDARLEEATRLYKIYNYDEAIRITKDVIADSKFDSLTTDVKIKAGLLLIHSYWAQEKRIEAKDAIDKLLAWRSDFPCDTLGNNPDLRERCLEEQTKLLQKPSQQFDFVALNQPVDAKAGKSVNVHVTTQPTSVPVTLSLDTTADNMLLRQLDSVSAVLTYTPLPSEAGATRGIRISGASRDTSKSLEITFKVKGGRSTGWWIKRVVIGVGGVVGVYILVRKIIDWIKGDNKEKELPGPPHPPGKSAIVIGSREREGR